MNLISELLKVLVAVIKSLFGIDKPAETEVKNAKPNKPLNDINSDDRLLGELGLRGYLRAASEDDVRDSTPRHTDANTRE